LFVQRSGRGAARLVDAAVKFPATISTIVIAVGFTLAFTGPPFNLQGTLWILLLAYLAIYMPQGSVAADAAASQVGDELTDASAICGAGGTRTFLRVSLPIMLPGLVAGWALLFVRMTGDLTASAILAGTGNNVVGFRILEVFEGGSFALLASLALALTVVTSTVLVILLTLSRRAAAYAIESPGG
jgi:iron(III) transport system permease protein